MNDIKASMPVHVVCPECWSTNRVPSVRLMDTPLCGKCKHSIFSGHPMDISAVNFDRFSQRSDIPLVVDFWAPWCGPCLSMAPAFEQAAKSLEPHFQFAKVNIDTEAALANRFAIQSVPTLCIFLKGKEESRRHGAVSTSSIIEWTAAYRPTVIG